MADEKQKGEDKAKRVEAKPKASDEAVEGTYARAEHIALAPAMYGVRGHVVSGALTLLDEKEPANDRNPAGEYTKSEVEAAIEAFRTRKVQKED